MRFPELKRSWNWLDDGLLLYLIAAVRALWIWLLLHLWAQLMQPPRAEVLGLPTIVTLLAGSALCTQLARFRLRDARGMWLVALGGVGAVTIALYGAFGPTVFQEPGATVIALLAGAWCWRWGITAAREPLTYGACAQSFLYGIVAMALVTFGAFTTGPLPAATLILPLLLFFAGSLATLALASLREAQKYERTETGASFALNPYWLGTVGVVVAGLVLIGFLLGGLFAPEWVQRALEGMVWLAQILMTVLIILAAVMAFLLFGALDWIGRVIHFTPSTGPPPPPPEMPRLDELFKDQQAAASRMSPELYLVVQVVSAIVLALLLAAMFAMAFRRFRNYGQDDVGETRESVFSTELLKEQLAHFLRRTRKAGEEKVEPFAPICGHDARAQIRRAYQQLLAWAAERGMARAAGQTPSEFGRTVESGFPGAREPLATITAAYVNARYSAAPVSNEEAARVAQALVQLIGERSVPMEQGR